MKVIESPYSSDNKYYRLVAERECNNKIPLANAIFEVVNSIKDHFPEWNHCFLGSNGPYSAVTLKQLKQYLVRVQVAWKEGLAEIFHITMQFEEFDINLFFDYESANSKKMEYCWFSLPPDLDADYSSVQFLKNIVKNVAISFGAYHCIIEDEELMMLYRGKFSALAATKNVPEELRKYIPTSPKINIPVQEFPELLVPQQFNRRKVPEAVWSINYWDAEQIKTIGLEKIRNAGWLEIQELPNDALLLTGINELTDVRNVMHLEKLTHIIRNLALYELQIRYINKP